MTYHLTTQSENIILIRDENNTTIAELYDPHIAEQIISNLNQSVPINTTGTIPSHLKTNFNLSKVKV